MSCTWGTWRWMRAPASGPAACSALAPRSGPAPSLAPGSAVFGEVPAGEAWAGAPARRTGRARGPWGDARPDNRPAWLVAYAAMAVLIATLPVLAVLAGLAAVWPWLGDARSLADAARTGLLWILLAAVVGLASLAVLVWALVRLQASVCPPATIPSTGGRRGRPGRSSVCWTSSHMALPAVLEHPHPAWLRVLGARIGAEVEASTVLLIPELTTVNDGAFLADDTLLGGYELGGGWLRVEQAKVGKHAFVGNSGMTAPGRRVPKRGLVAVLSAAPRRTKAKAGTSCSEARPPSCAGPSRPATAAAPTTLQRGSGVARALVGAVPAGRRLRKRGPVPGRRAGHRA